MNHVAISHLDRYIVCRLSDGAPVEGHFNLQPATDAARTLDEHNQRNGHEERYVVRSRESVFLKDGETYLGWRIAHQRRAPRTGRWAASRYGVELCAGESWMLRRMINQKAEDMRAANPERGLF